MICCTMDSISFKAKLIFLLTRRKNYLFHCARRYFFYGSIMFDFFVLCLLCLCARLFICALGSPARKGLTSCTSFVVSNCEFVTFPLVPWVRCGT